jgi:hypothetical protein
MTVARPEKAGRLPRRKRADLASDRSDREPDALVRPRGVRARPRRNVRPRYGPTRKGVSYARSGSVIVFVALLVGSLVFGCLGIAEASSYLAAESYFGDVARIAELSLLGRYQKDLFARYGIYGLSETPETYEERLRTAMNGSFVKLAGADRMHISLGDVTFDGTDYALSRTDLVRRNVLAKVRADLPYTVIGEADLFGGKEDDAPFDREEAEGTFRTLRNRGVIGSLPSRLADTPGLSLDALSEWDPASLIRNAGSEALVNLYIRSCFATYRSPNPPEVSFFRNEIEYILAGKTGDRENLNAVKVYLAALRTPLNAAYLYASPLRLEEAAALAAAISGPAAVWTTQAILALWNLAETACDVVLLLRGERIPLVKTDETWNLSVGKLAERFLSGDPDDAAASDESLAAKAEEGLSYGDYLTLLLFFENAETKMLRMMDVIQLNLIMTSQSTFSFARTYAGFAVEAGWTQTRRSLLPLSLRGRVYRNERGYFDAP